MEKPISTIIVRNILGCICGLLVGWLAYMFIGVIFGFLFSIEWVAKLLSWPSTPILYMSTGMGAFGALQAHTVSDKICLENSKGYKWGTTLVGFIIFIYFAYCVVVNWIRYGFSDFIYGYIFTALMGLYIIYSSRQDKIFRAV
jgi:hypothetical protein